MTTSYFSSQVQKEILDDQYPVMLINGLEIAKATNNILYRDGISIDEFFDRIDNLYDIMCKNRRPEEILLD